MQTQNFNSSTAALVALITLQLAMLSALYAQIPPHPPMTTPLFGIAPFIGASVAAALAAISLGGTQTVSGRILSVIAALMAAISFGPQKYFDVQFSLIWPAVISGQIAIVTLIYLTIKKPLQSSGEVQQ
jgi:hypothetical protein